MSDDDLYVYYSSEKKWTQPSVPQTLVELGNALSNPIPEGAKLYLLVEAIGGAAEVQRRVEATRARYAERNAKFAEMSRAVREKEAEVHKLLHTAANTETDEEGLEAWLKHRAAKREEIVLRDELNAYDDANKDLKKFDGEDW